MDIGTFRSLIRSFSRNAGDETYYSPAMLDFAGQAAADELIRRARLLRVTTTKATVANNNVLTSLSYTPDRLIKIYLSGANVVVNLSADYPRRGGQYVEGQTEYDDSGLNRTSRITVKDVVSVNDLVIATGTTGQPYMGGFTTVPNFNLYPTPDAVYTVNFVWSDIFTTWTPGDTGSDATVINLADDYLRMVVLYGAPSFLQANDPEHAFASKSWQIFQNYINEMLGKGGSGEEVITPSRRW